MELLRERWFLVLPAVLPRRGLSGFCYVALPVFPAKDEGFGLRGQFDHELCCPNGVFATLWHA